MSYSLYVDGGGQHKNTYFSFKVFIEEKSKPLYHMNRFLLRNLTPDLLPPETSITNSRGNETNNIAEYAALYYGLLWFLENVGTKPKVTVYQDSQLIIRQVLGEYRCKQKHLQPWHTAVYMNLWPNLTLTHVRREKIVPVLRH